MTSMVFVDRDGLKGAALRRWVDTAIAFARELPPKPAGYRGRQP